MAQCINLQSAGRLPHIGITNARRIAAYCAGAQRAFASTSATPYKSIKSATAGAAGIITICKPKALNALSSRASLQATLS